MIKQKHKSIIKFSIILMSILFCISHQMIVKRDELNYQTGQNYIGTLPRTRA